MRNDKTAIVDAILDLRVMEFSPDRLNLIWRIGSIFMTSSLFYKKNQAAAGIVRSKPGRSTQGADDEVVDSGPRLSLESTAKVQKSEQSAEPLPAKAGGFRSRLKVA